VVAHAQLLSVYVAWVVPGVDAVSQFFDELRRFVERVEEGAAVFGAQLLEVWSGARAEVLSVSREEVPASLAARAALADAHEMLVVLDVVAEGFDLGVGHGFTHLAVQGPMGDIINQTIRAVTRTARASVPDQRKQPILKMVNTMSSLIFSPDSAM
jgi:hypothetical protein